MTQQALNDVRSRVPDKEVDLKKQQQVMKMMVVVMMMVMMMMMMMMMMTIMVKSLVFEAPKKASEMR